MNAILLLNASYEPLAVRQLILNSHYRSPLDFSDAALYSALSGYGKITEAVKAVRKRLTTAPEGPIDNETADQLKQLTDKFEIAMNDDLNTSVALSVVFDLVRLANTVLQNGKATVDTLRAVNDLFGKLGGNVLGIVRSEYPQMDAADDEMMDKLVNVLIEQRAQARKNKDFATADGLRNRLDEIGIALEDTPEGTTWRIK